MCEGVMTDEQILLLWQNQNKFKGLNNQISVLDQWKRSNKSPLPDDMLDEIIYQQLPANIFPTVYEKDKFIAAAKALVRLLLPKHNFSIFSKVEIDRDSEVSQPQQSASVAKKG